MFSKTVCGKPVRWLRISAMVSYLDRGCSPILGPRGAEIEKPGEGRVIWGAFILGKECSAFSNAGEK